MTLEYQALLKRVEALEATVKELHQANNQLRTQLSNSNTQPAISFKQALVGGKLSEEAVCMLAVQRAEINEASKRQNNLIISGLPSPINDDSKEREEADNKQIAEVLTTLEVDKHCVRKPRRMNNRNGKPGNLVIVEMDSEVARNSALKNAIRLAGTKIYVNRDMTDAERRAERELRAERNRKNGELEHTDGKNRFGIDDQRRKFYYGIRSGIVKRVFIRI